MGSWDGWAPRERDNGMLDKPHSGDSSPWPVHAPFFVIPSHRSDVFFPLHNSHSQSPQCATKASLQASSLLILVDGNCLLPTQSIDLILIQLLHCSSRMSIVSRWPWNCCPWKQKNWHLLKSIWRNKRNVCCSFLESYPLWEIQAFPVTQCSKPETTMTPGIVMEMQWALRMTKSSSDSP